MHNCKQIHPYHRIHGERQPLRSAPPKEEEVYWGLENRNRLLNCEGNGLPTQHEENITPRPQKLKCVDWRGLESSEALRLRFVCTEEETKKTQKSGNLSVDGALSHQKLRQNWLIRRCLQLRSYFVVAAQLENSLRRSFRTSSDRFGRVRLRPSTVRPCAWMLIFKKYNERLSKKETKRETHFYPDSKSVRSQDIC